MDKTINALGLMSGTSIDGIDASLIRSDGEKNIEIIGNLFLKYDSELKNSFFKFIHKINSIKDINQNIEEYKSLERKITIKHSEIASEICEKYNFKPSIVGFHGQTIIHKPKNNYSIQMGNGKLLAQLLKTNVVYEFRKNDIKNGGEGAPLTPIYHNCLKNKFNLRRNTLFLNIGGIANCSFIDDVSIFAKDVGPGNCLMDMYINKTKQLDFDDGGKIASSGNVDKVLINNLLDHDDYNSIDKHSLDVKDFDINFVKGLSTEDALANLNFLTSKIISENIIKNFKGDFIIILCGGGRKNKTLISNLKFFLKNDIYNIDEFGIDGDFVESQAFAYLGIRSIYKKNISFPNTTKVNTPSTGGELIKSN